MDQIETTKTVFITGAGSGIGLSCVRWFADRTWRVFAGYRKESDGAQLGAIDGVKPVRVDVTDQEEISAAAQRIVEETGGRLDALVNNAGIVVAAPLEFVPIEALRRQLEVNVTAQVSVTQACLPLLREARGRIIFMGSSSGRFAAPFMGPYCASKFALEAIADSLRRELRSFGLRVAIVEPGAIQTPIWDKSRREADKLLESLPPEGERLYGAVIPKVREAAEKTAAGAIPPERVAAAVFHAATARRPRPRYPVGFDARLQNWMERLLPTYWVDALVARFMQF